MVRIEGGAIAGAAVLCAALKAVLALNDRQMVLKLELDVIPPQGQQRLAGDERSEPLAVVKFDLSAPLQLPQEGQQQAFRLFMSQIRDIMAQ